MRVDPVAGGVVGKASRPAPGAPGFAALLTPPDQAPRPAPTQTASALADAAYQAGQAAEQADQAARRHGKALLNALATLQRALLGPPGYGPSQGAEADARADLAALAANPPEADDPVLRLVLREIGVRAAVELARPGV